MSRANSGSASSTDRQAFLDGEHGAQIEIEELLDGDDDPLTFLLDAGPAGLIRQASHDVWISDPSVSTSRSNFVELQFNPLSENAPTLGFVNWNEPGLAIGRRASDGSVGVHGLPANAVTAAFVSGPERYWAKVSHGVAAFPYRERAAANVRVNVYDASGRQIESFEGTSSYMTTTEVAKAAVTGETGDRLGTVWSMDEGPDQDRQRYGRSKGRTGLTGFRGPFAAQNILSCRGCSPSDTWIITVRSKDTAEISRRLLIFGGVVRTFEKPDDITVVIWTDATTDPSEIERIVGRLTPAKIDSTWTFTHDGPRSFREGPRAPLGIYPRDDLAPLLIDTVGDVAGAHITAQVDDLGVTAFDMLQPSSAPDGTSTVSGWGLMVGPLDQPLHEGEQRPELPTVGQSLLPGLYALPADVSSITITLSDQQVLRPTLLDATRYAPAKLMVVPSTAAAGQFEPQRFTTITAIAVT